MCYLRETSDAISVLESVLRTFELSNVFRTQREIWQFNKDRVAVNIAPLV